MTYDRSCWDLGSTSNQTTAVSEPPAADPSRLDSLSDVLREAATEIREEWTRMRDTDGPLSLSGPPRHDGWDTAYPVRWQRVTSGSVDGPRAGE